MVVYDQDKFTPQPVHDLIIGLALEFAAFRLVALFKAQSKGAGARCVIISLNAHDRLLHAKKLLIVVCEVANSVLVSWKEDRTLSIASLDFIDIRLKSQLLSGAVATRNRCKINILSI